MRVRKSNYPASAVSHTGKKRKKLYVNRKSCMAMVLSAAMLFTSVDGMTVHAEELADLIPPVSEEEAPENPDNSENPDNPENPDVPADGDNAQEGPSYVKNEAGAIIIKSFVPFEDDIEIEKGETRLELSELIEKINSEVTVKVNVDEYVEDPAPEGQPGEGEGQPGEGEGQPGEGEGQPGEGEGQPGEGEGQPGEGEGQPGEGEGQPGEGEGQPGGGEGQPGEGEGQPGGGEGQPGEGEGQPGGGDSQPGEGGDQPGGGEGQPGEGEGQPGGGDSQPGEGGDQPGEGEDQPGEGGDQPGGGEGQPSEGGDQPGEDADNNNGGSDSQSGTGDIATAGINGTYAVDDGHQWRLLVAADETVVNNTYDTDDEGSNGEGGSDTGTGDNGEGGNGAGTGDNGEGGNGAGTGDNGEGGNGAGTGDNGEGGNGAGTGDSGEGGDGAGTGDSGEGGNGAGTGDSGEGGNGAGTGDSREGGNGAGTGDGGEGGNGAGTGDSGEGGDGAGTGDSGEGGNGAGTGDNGEGGNGAGTGDNGESGDGTGAGDNGEGGDGTGDPDTDIPLADGERPTQPATIEWIHGTDFQWVCDEDYEAVEQDVYTFHPEWTTDWFYDETVEGAAVPTITVSYVDPATEISSEDELAAAFAAGSTRIILHNDIELTKPLVLPADVIIELDGDGHSLTRGKEGEDSDTFLGIMINMDGTDYTRDRFGRLTLTNITVDGTADRAAAPAIVDWGKLTLGEGAKVIANNNYGTPGNSEGHTEGIPEYGGGICVYRELVLEDHGQSSVTGNYADLLGGGVYLERNAELWLYGDVIKDNTVKEPADEHGPDLFARPYSKIHYNKDVFSDIQSWPTFYLSKGVILIPIGEDEEIPEPEEGSKKEIYIAASKDSGYSAAELLELKQRLQALGYKVISNQRTEIDTTDLRNWNVYDHYDTGLWPGGSGNTPSPEWSEAYKEYRNRPYYPYTEMSGYYDSTGTATTIKEWLEAVEKGGYRRGSQLLLARFKEHIYSREENGNALMTFAGYGRSPYIDFCYIDPYSAGEKVVCFDVDSSMLTTHTLLGNGFLINAGTKSGYIEGYILYYQYSGTRAVNLNLYRLKNRVDVNEFHNSIRYQNAGGSNQDAYIDYWADLVESKPITSWNDSMSIKIKVSPPRQGEENYKVEVWQQPQTDTEIDESTEVFFSHELEDTGFSGYGPLVAYNSHACDYASTFTYSNLYMYFTDPTEMESDMMSPLAGADFTQSDTQKYFVNLFGADNLEYGKEDFKNYPGYLQMMQEEGIALITDRDAPFEEYLGSADSPQGEHDPGNLKELAGGAPGNKLSIDDLVNQIDGYLSGRKSTSLKETVGRGLTPADSKESVGNIWLKSGEEQFRDLDWSQSEGTGRAVQIMDDISCYNGEDVSVIYEIQRPGKASYTSLTLSGDKTFEIRKNRATWPEGSYTVRQTILESGVPCAIKGYAYFNITYPPEYVDPVTYPVTVEVTARLDGEVWPVTDHQKSFMLQPVGGGALVDPSLPVPAGNYTVCEVISLAEDGTLEEGVDTGVLVQAEDAETPNQKTGAIVDYCSVAFYDAFPGDEPYEDDTKWAKQFILQGRKAEDPGEPEKDKLEFVGWVTEEGDAYDFEQTVTSGPIKLYAKWLYPVRVKVAAHLDGGDWTEAEHGKRFMLRPVGGGVLIDLKDPMPTGEYTVCEVIRVAEDGTLAEGVDTGVSVNIENVDTDDKEIEAVVDYYTVKFYDAFPDGHLYGDETKWAKQIVLKGGKAEIPETPEKEKFSFTGWVTKDGSAEGKPFVPDQFDQINGPVELFAKWEKVEEPRYKVDIEARKDGGEWQDANRRFALKGVVEGEEQTVYDLAHVLNGEYRIYDITGGNPASRGPRAIGLDTNVKVDDGDTGVTIKVEGKDVAEEVNYYTVTFYDGEKAYGIDTPQCPMIVLKGKKMVKPEVSPKKSGYKFISWRSAKGGSTEFNFDRPVERKTDIYAFFKANAKSSGGEKPDENPPGGGEEQTVTVQQQAAPQARTDVAKEPDGKEPGEPKTSDSVPVEIYATVAMVAGLTYLLLYFMEESRGMTEREKEVFVAAFIRWAKKGGRFRRCCAIVAIFCLLVYYHSIGKRAGRNDMKREYLKQAL